MPTEKYAHGPEILEHSRRIGEQFGLYENALFHTEVRDLEWNEPVRFGLSVPTVAMSSPHSSLRLVLVLCMCRSYRALRASTSLKGAPSTSRWDYEYTGGDPSGALMTKLADKKVGIIGTGATSVQCVPHLAKGLR